MPALWKKNWSFLYPEPQINFHKLHLQLGDQGMKHVPLTPCSVAFKPVSNLFSLTEAVHKPEHELSTLPEDSQSLGKSIQKLVFQ